MMCRSALETLLAAESTTVRETADEQSVRKRQHEETEPREHVFLLQTVPPVDPTVAAIERRRSGGNDDEWV
ncbi:MAG: hypothetical protein AAGF11_44350 [Myxococcota bacterium]